MEKIYLGFGVLMLCLFAYFSWSGATYFGSFRGAAFSARSGGFIYHK